MATPHVTSAVALMLSLNSNVNANLPPMTVNEIRDILKSTATDGKINLIASLEKIMLRE